MVNLKELSQLSGYDISTVSRALQNSSRVKTETKCKILDLAKELNYYPDSRARSLKVNKGSLIGIIIPEFSNSFYSDICEGLESVLSNEQYSTIFGKSNFDFEQEKKCIDTFMQNRVDGIIVCATSDKLVDYMHTIKIPVPVILAEANDDNAHDDQWGRIIIDNYLGIGSVVSHLVGLGHRRIGFISDSKVTKLRQSAFVESMRDNMLPLPEDYISVGIERNESGGYVRMKQLLNLKEPPTAVLAATDHLAIGAISAIYESGLSIPDDISISGFDDISLSAHLAVPLTTVSQPKQEIGRLAAQKLLAVIKDGQNTLGSTFLQPTLIVRKSTAPPSRESQANALPAGLRAVR